VKSLLDNGALLTSSGDHPVSPINNPFWAIEAAVTRNLNNAGYYGVDDIKDINDPTWLLDPADKGFRLDICESLFHKRRLSAFREKSNGSLSW
jgi:hypothetical protein